MSASALPWPAHTRAVRQWRQAARGGSRADRELREIEVWLPPLIADRPIRMPDQLAQLVEHAHRVIHDLDVEHGRDLAGLGAMLLRAESVASSKIEHLEAPTADYVRALHGNRSNTSATAMAAATTAVGELIGSVSSGESISVDALLRAHRALMRDDPVEKSYAGRLRDVQNWIGGSDHSPRGALFIPPPPSTVPKYVDDVVAFSNRLDVPALAQAALAHAQFESIHPFTDGNGRIGRALVNAILRRRGATRTVVVPLASALVGRREAYFDLLTRYRLGEPDDLVASFARAATLVAEESVVTAGRLRGLPDRWRDAVGGVRRGSAIAAVIEALPAEPVVTAEGIESLTGSGSSTTYRVVDRLVDAGVLVALTSRLRDQVWGAVDVLGEMDDLALRIGSRAGEALGT